MFIISLRYVKPIEEVEKNLNEHIAFLDKYYAAKNFICSGRKNPRVGGVIICIARDKEEVERIISEDPFYYNGVAEYSVTEFIPTKCADELKDYLLNK